jgi:hypothetical protein
MYAIQITMYSNCPEFYIRTNTFYIDTFYFSECQAKAIHICIEK